VLGAFSTWLAEIQAASLPELLAYLFLTIPSSGRPATGSAVFIMFDRSNKMAFG